MHLRAPACLTTLQNATGSPASVMSDSFIVELQDAQLQGVLSRAVAQLEAPRKLLDNIGGLLEERVNLRFKTKTDPDGVPWLPLAPSTVKRYEKRYKGAIPGSLLERTRDMVQSLTHNTSDNFVDVGFSNIKAAYHETGTSRGLPRRSMLTGDFVAGTLGEGDAQAVLAEVDRFLAALF